MQTVADERCNTQAIIRWQRELHTVHGSMKKQLVEGTSHCLLTKATRSKRPGSEPCAPGLSKQLTRQVHKRTACASEPP